MSEVQGLCDKVCSSCLMLQPVNAWQSRLRLDFDIWRRRTSDTVRALLCLKNAPAADCSRIKFAGWIQKLMAKFAQQGC